MENNNSQMTFEICATKLSIKKYTKRINPVLITQLH